MFLLAHIDFTLPLEDPILKFLLILVIILAAPLILNKLKIPYLLGLIIAGAVIGPHGLNLVLRDSSIILSGTAGLLYIMFLSGLDMDMSDFRRNSWRSLIFGLYTFCVPLGLGILAGYYILGFPIYSSILLAGLFASQTLIAYPIVSKLGIARDKAVTIAVGGTVITDTLALLLLTVIVGMATGNVDDTFWWRLGISVLVCILIIVVLFPIIAHWFFKLCSDNVSQYIFVLAMVFLGAFLAQLAGLEPIIGAFLSGLALNRLIPKTSPLMNRIEFVGNAIFIPFFLIGVGMLIDYRAFFRDWESLEVAAVMIALITVAKFIAAWLTQKSFRLSKDQRTVIFGLSSAHVAATLAAVMVGYNVILGHTPDGEPIRLLSESVLNGTILMILATCIVSTFATQRGAHNIAVKNALQTNDEEKSRPEEHILIPVANEQSVDELVGLSATIKRAKEPNGLYALHAIDNRVDDPNMEKRARKLLDGAAKTAAAGALYLQQAQTARHGGAGGGIGRQLHAATAPLRREHRKCHRQHGARTEHHRHRTGHAPANPRLHGAARHSRNPGHSRHVGARHRKDGDRRAVAEQRHHLHLQPGPAALDHQAPPGHRPARRREGGRIPDVAAAHPPAGPQYRGEGGFLRLRRHAPAHPPAPRTESPGQHRLRPLRPLGRPSVARTRPARRRLSVVRHEPPRPGIVPPGDEPHPGLPRAGVRRLQRRAGLPRTGRRHGPLPLMHGGPDVRGFRQIARKIFQPRGFALSLRNGTMP